MDQTVTLHPYIAFDGNCREAFTFYKEALGADEFDLNSFEGSPMADKIPQDYLDKIMHARLIVGNITLMGSDGMPNFKREVGNDIKISLNPTKVEDAERLFNALSEGGKIEMPLQDTFWGAKFGMFTDKFGVGWMVNCLKTPQA